LKDIDAVAKEYQIRGKLNIHGKSKTIVILAKLKKANQGIEFTASFALNTDDFRIEIPSIVRSKISKNVNTEISCLLQ
jgi:polyisoprenoid-binding protein YceI